MAVSWGYSPKIEKYIPLGDFPADRYLIIARQAIENLGWKLSHISENGLIAYTNLSWQSYSEEISVRIDSNFAVVKSECVGLQMWFNDYGKNDQNLEKFFHEFEYVEFHLKDTWEEKVAEFHEFALAQDKDYFEKAPLAVKNKIRNVLYLLWPQKGYQATPVLLWLNVFYFGFTLVFSYVYFRYIFLPKLSVPVDPQIIINEVKQLMLNFGVNNRKLVLDGQYWRLLSYQFIHANLSHLFFNLYALVYMGLMIENKLGWRRFLFVYLLSGICGGLLSIIYHQEGVMVGASGAIMGLYGAFIALLLNKSYEKNAAKALLISTLIIVVLVLINGWFSLRTDNAGHIGGVISGFVICYLLSFKTNATTMMWPRYAVTSVLCLLFAIGVIGFSPSYQTNELKLLNKEYVKNANAFNKVMSLRASLTQEEKLAFIEENGITPSKNNVEVVKKMKKLTLKDEDLPEIKFKEQVAEKSYEVALLMKKDIESGDYRYRKQVNKLMNELIVFSANAGEK